MSSDLRRGLPASRGVVLDICEAWAQTRRTPPARAMATIGRWGSTPWQLPGQQGGKWGLKGPASRYPRREATETVDWTQYRLRTGTGGPDPIPWATAMTRARELGQDVAAVDEASPRRGGTSAFWDPRLRDHACFVAPPNGGFGRHDGRVRVRQQGAPVPSGAVPLMSGWAALRPRGRHP
jgi:hypothetical protein